MNTKAIRQLADVTLDKYRSSIPRKAFEEFVKDIITGENRATAFRYEASPICRASFPSTLDEDGARCTVEVTVYRLNAVAATAFLLDGPDVIPNADDWWWLSTAFSTKSNGYESLARFVYTDGTLNWNYAYYGYYGLRPACYLDSDLLISIEDDEATDDVTPEHAGEIIAALAEQFGGTFATEDQLTTALSFMLGTLRATREKEARHE